MITILYANARVGHEIISPASFLFLSKIETQHIFQLFTVLSQPFAFSACARVRVCGCVLFLIFVLRLMHKFHNH